MSLATVSGSMAAIHEGGLTPVAAASAGFNTGKPLAGLSLFEAYTSAASSDIRTTTIANLVAEGLSCSEFDEAVKQAIAQGAAADKMAGFAPPEGAKGRDKYGPKQNTMVQRATEMRQIFGYLKQTNPAMHAGGYLETLKVARNWLSDKGVTWDGNKAKTREDRNAEKERAAFAEALQAAALEVPPGQQGDMASIHARALEIVNKKKEEAELEKLQKLAQGLVDAHSLDMVYSLACALLQTCVQEGGVTVAEIVTEVSTYVTTE